MPIELGFGLFLASGALKPPAGVRAVSYAGLPDLRAQGKAALIAIAYGLPQHGFAER
jgi:hypothetical protein